MTRTRRQERNQMEEETYYEENDNRYEEGADGEIPP